MVGGVAELKDDAVMELDRPIELGLLPGEEEEEEDEDEEEKGAKLSIIRSSALEKLDPLPLENLLDPLPDEKLEPEEEKPLLLPLLENPLLLGVKPDPLFELKLDPELPDRAENEGFPIKD